MIQRLTLFLSIIALSFPLFGQSDTDGVIITALQIDNESQAKDCYTIKYDVLTARMIFGFDDTLNLLEDFAYEEEHYDPSDCFIPELKLTFRYYTYVISLECARAVKYQNSSAFVPTAKRMPNDLVFTPSVDSYLRSLMARKFPGHGADPILVRKALDIDYMGEKPTLSEMEDILYDEDIDEEEDDLFDLDDPEDDDLFDHFEGEDLDDLDDLEDLEDLDDDDGDGDGKKKIKK